MNIQERQSYWLNRYDEIKIRETELIRLLKLTKDNQSTIIQDLRKAIVDYVNKTEKYISDIEIENSELSNLFLDVTDINNENCELLKKHITSFRNDKCIKCLKDDRPGDNR